MISCLEMLKFKWVKFDGWLDFSFYQLDLYEE